MDGQMHRGTGDNIGRDQTKIELQINQGSGSTYIKNQYLPPAEESISPHLTSEPCIPNVFQGRDADLAAIRTTLETSNKPLLLVNGEGGIGKTSLAAKYWQRYKDKYKHTAWLYAPSRMDDALLSLAKALKVTFPDTMPTEQRLEELQRAIANLPEFCLLIIDNANNAEELATQWGFLSKCSNCHILLTSRINSFDDAACYRVEALSEADALNVFKTHYKRHRIEDDELFGSIYQAVGGNTLVLVLLAKNLAAVNDNKVFYPLSQLLEDLQKRGLLQLSKAKPVQIMGKGSQSALETVEPTKVIAALYDELEQIKPLSEAERWVLCNFSVFPAENLAYEYLEALLLTANEYEEAFSEVISGLARRGWLERSHQDSGIYYKISPVVQEIIRHKNSGCLQDYCSVLVNKLIGRLAHDTNTGDLLNTHYEKAVDYCRYAEAVTDRLLGNHTIGLLDTRIGRYHLTTGNLDKALKHFTKVHDLMAILYQREPDDIDVKRDLAISCQYLGNIHTKLGNIELALGWYEEHYDLVQKLHAAASDNSDFKNGLAVACSKMGNIYALQGDFRQALHWYEEFYRLIKELHTSINDNLVFKNGLATACQYLGAVHTELNNIDQALYWYKKDYQLVKELHATDHDHPDFKYGLSVACAKLGDTYITLGDQKQALYWLEEHLRLARELYAPSSSHLEFKYSLVISIINLGFYYEQQVKTSLTLYYYREAQVLLMQLVAQSPLDMEFKERLNWVSNRLSVFDTKGVFHFLIKTMLNLRFLIKRINKYRNFTTK
ncbi:tetratricopeptide repeat protein [Methylovulum psychrotolerans]|uniref:tetratricopeptide repeat protein n=1 Tax=Methylovulum psychrotolerans TaxID=1704499 RepID=UPI001BFF400D|nr:tetratricopeptide repeat protein [Methylovulum psychrotolerans]MBT9099009.1 tetratricopeptide repeat protein [Methylovulum psychrotolerans]